MTVDKRASKRKWLSGPAVLAQADGTIIGACRIVDVSETGMKLRLLRPRKAGGQVIVLLSKDGSVRRNATVQWQAGKDIGVQFHRRQGSRYSVRNASGETVWV